MTITNLFIQKAVQQPNNCWSCTGGNLSCKSNVIGVVIYDTNLAFIN